MAHPRTFRFGVQVSSYITLAQGGTTVIEMYVGQSSYRGSTSYGITTLSWGSWEGSFVVVR